MQVGTDALVEKRCHRRCVLGGAYTALVALGGLWAWPQTQAEQRAGLG